MKSGCLTAVKHTCLFLLLLMQAVGCSSVRRVAIGDSFFGTASYYGDGYQCRTTASGEVFDKNELTAAHRSLPFGTVVQVTNLENENSVELRINDRGPYVRGRIIDVSEHAAEILNFIRQGTVKVRIVITQCCEGDSLVQIPAILRTW